ncbi:unnamed protein product [Caenorhabditis brenneri]
MSEDPGSGFKKPMEPSSLLEAIFIFIGSLLFKAIEYLSAFTHIFHKSSTPPKSFSYLPVDVVDSQKPAWKSILVNCLKKGIGIEMNEVSVAYTSSADYDAMLRYDDFDMIVVRDDFKKVAFDGLTSTIKNPRLKWDYFSVGFGLCDEEDIMTCYNNIQCILKPLKHRLSIKKVRLNVLYPSNLLSILPYLKPGFLEYISIRPHVGTGEEINWRIDLTGMDQVALLEQWKQAEVLELENCFDRFPMEFATHFKRFYIDEEEIEIDTLIRIRDYLSKLQNLEQCTLYSLRFYSNSDVFHEVLGAPVSSKTTETIFHHHIPDSDYYLEFTKPTRGCDVEIVKKKREDNRLLRCVESILLLFSIRSS